MTGDISSLKSFRYNNLLSCKQPIKRKEAMLGICVFCGIDQVQRVPEIVAYHSLVGVDRFFIYYNANDKEISEKWHYFKSLVESRKIEFIPWYFKTRSYIDGIQTAAYNDCLYKLKDQVKWLGILDTDEYFMLTPSNPYKLLTDYLNSVETYSVVSFPTNCFAINPINATGHFMEKCIYPSFINQWLWMADENEKRPPKSIYRTDQVTYADIHGPRGFNGSTLLVNSKDAILGHYRYPYMPYTIDGVFDGTYQRNDYYKRVYGNRILKSLYEMGFNENKANCKAN